MTPPLLLLSLGLLAALAAQPPGLRAQEAPPLPRPAAQAAAPAAPAAAEVDPAEAAALFALPRLAEETRQVLGLVQAGDLAAAAERLDAMIARHPGLGLLRANRAALAMLEGAPQAALASLEAAQAAGFSDMAAVAADPLFAPLAGEARFAALLAAAPAPPPPKAPAPVRGGAALVAAANTDWNPATERLEPRFDFPPAPSAPVLPDAPKLAALDLVREHMRRGRAAGNHGDLYDNRDRGHSALKRADHPQLTHVTYAPAARAADLDYGLNESLIFEGVTFGNSSTALTGGPFWRSLPRHALTRPDGTGPLRLWQNADANHLYVYPAHKDVTDEQGDLFPANTPYILVSRGSSGSDQPILEAIALMLAALRPETKARLAEERLIVPALQMIFRRSLQNVRSREAYLSGDAHPAAFEGFNVNAARMVSLAQSIDPDALPAEARLRVVSETLGTEGRDFFGQGLSEILFDTPSAIARVWRAQAGRREMILSAEDSRDANGRALAYEWRLLQGDPERVTIEPLDGGRRARITLDWHEPFTISEENPRLSSRVDIGLFAGNGVHDSAPAIMSWYFPPHEARSYAPGPDGAPRLVSLDHAARPQVYADPMLLPRAAWRDDFRYDAAGALTGWTRSRPGGPSDEYTAEGRRILTRDAAGAPARSEAVAYPLRRAPSGALEITEISAP